MRKIIVIISIFLLFISNSYALFPSAMMMKPYNPNNSSGSTINQNKSIISKEQEEIEKYKETFSSQLSNKIGKLSDEKINNILEKVDNLIVKYNISKLPLKSKQKALYQLKAIKIILGGELENRNSLGENINIDEIIENDNIKINCKSDEHIENNICVSNAKSCEITNGNGLQTWSSQKGWESCFVKNCDNGYKTTNASLCVKKEEVKIEEIKDDVKTLTCKSDEHIENNICVSKIANPCKINEHIEANTCVSDTKKCTMGNFTGEQIWKSYYWTSCQFTSCNSDRYELKNGECILKTGSGASLSIEVDNNNSQITKTKNILGNRTSPFVAVFKLTAVNKPIKIKALNIIATETTDGDFKNAVSHITLFEGPSQEIVRESVTGLTTSFSDVNINVDIERPEIKASNYIYVKVVTREQAGIQSGDITLKMEITSAESYDDPIDLPEITSSSNAFFVTPSN